MLSGDLDQMIEYVVGCLAEADPRVHRVIVRTMAQRWPNEPGLAIVFALTSGAAHVEDLLDTDASKQAVHTGYRLAALVAADVYAIEAMGQHPARGRDLMHFWRRTGDDFLRV